MKERTKRINQAYRWLIWLGEVDDKLSFAQRLGKERANITNILNGKGDASDRFCGLILESFPGVFNRNWLLDGVGEMLTSPSGLPTYYGLNRNTPSVENETQDQSNIIIDLYAGLIQESESFRSIIQNELTEVRNLRNELKQERENLREATYRLTQALSRITQKSDNTQYMGIAAEDSTTNY